MSTATETKKDEALAKYLACVWATARGERPATLPDDGTMAAVDRMEDSFAADLTTARARLKAAAELSEAEKMDRLANEATEGPANLDPSQFRTMGELVAAMDAVRQCKGLTPQKMVSISQRSNAQYLRLNAKRVLRASASRELHTAEQIIVRQIGELRQAIAKRSEDATELEATLQRDFTLALAKVARFGRPEDKKALSKIRDQLRTIRSAAYKTQLQKNVKENARDRQEIVALEAKLTDIGQEMLKPENMKVSSADI